MSELETKYTSRFQKVLTPIATRLEEHIRGYLSDRDRIDRVTARAKAVDRFLTKAMKQKNGALKYDDPLTQIQDQVGARIITYYLSDVERVKDSILKYFTPIEKKNMVPETEKEFGYEGYHYILMLPLDVLVGLPEGCEFPETFELQIKTLFQHAWAESEHDLSYKAPTQLTSKQKRKIAFTAAQSWGADLIFDELYRELGNNDTDSE